MSVQAENNEQFIRTEMVIGKEAQDILKSKKVCLNQATLVNTDIEPVEGGTHERG